MRRRPLTMAALLALPLASCAGFKKVQIFTEPQEMAIGEVFSSEVESFMPILLDPRVSWYVNHRGRQFADSSDRRNLPYRFGIIDTPELNAFAIPGGHIYFNLGMIEATESECELMGIVAHEIGHVVAQHSMKQLSQQSIVSIVGTIALNQYPNQWAALAANLFGATGFLKMSRDAEREADAIGFALMLRMGYHPEGMKAIFEKLLQRYDEEPGLLDKLFSTHPPTRERIANIDAMITGADLPPNLIRTTPEYERMYQYVVDTYYSESGRQRWKEMLEAKKQEDIRAEDRLPWDTKEDERRKKRQEKEERKQEEERRKKDQRERRDTPGEAEPEPDAAVAAGTAGVAR